MECIRFWKFHRCTILPGISLSIWEQRSIKFRRYLSQLWHIFFGERALLFVGGLCVRWTIEAGCWILEFNHIFIYYIHLHQRVNQYILYHETMVHNSYFISFCRPSNSHNMLETVKHGKLSLTLYQKCLTLSWSYTGKNQWYCHYKYENYELTFSCVSSIKFVITGNIVKVL